MRYLRSNSISLDKEGPIHDVTWSPNSKEFGVVYGYMPAKTTIFNERAVAAHSFALAPRNTIAYSPHGRFVAIAGFGNLAGQMDIYDIDKDYRKVTTIEASNTSVCEWSPDGRHILTATTSPRLRVDNGVRIWHVGGSLMYNEDMNELYDVRWRPQSTTQYPLEDPFHPMPTPHPSALEYLATKKTPSKPAGAYRPPGARGQTTPLAFRREDEGGAAHVRDGTTPGFGSGVNGFGKSKRRAVPGAEPSEEHHPPGAAPGGGVALPPGAGGGGGEEKLSKSAAKNKKKREAKKTKETTEKDGGMPVDASASASPEHRRHERSRSRGNLDPSSQSRANGRDGSHSAHRHQRSDHNNTSNQPRPQQQGQSQGQGRSNGKPANNSNNSKTKPSPSGGAPPSTSAPVVTVTTPAAGGEGGEGGNNASPHDKKIRGLLKKMRAIDDLKMRVAGGEQLEDTQVKKIQTEDGVRKELEGLGWSG